MLGIERLAAVAVFAGAAAVNGFAAECLFADAVAELLAVLRLAAAAYFDGLPFGGGAGKQHGIVRSGGGGRPASGGRSGRRPNGFSSGLLHIGLKRRSRILSIRHGFFNKGRLKTANGGSGPTLPDRAKYRGRLKTRLRLAPCGRRADVPDSLGQCLLLPKAVILCKLRPILVGVPARAETAKRGIR